MTTRAEAYAELGALYAQLPPIECKGRMTRVALALVVLGSLLCEAGVLVELTR